MILILPAVLTTTRCCWEGDEEAVSSRACWAAACDAAVPEVGVPDAELAEAPDAELEAAPRDETDPDAVETEDGSWPAARAA